jgi:hypothetical protein
MQAMEACGQGMHAVDTILQHIYAYSGLSLSELPCAESLMPKSLTKLQKHHDHCMQLKPLSKLTQNNWRYIPTMYSSKF